MQRRLPSARHVLAALVLAVVAGGCTSAASTTPVPAPVVGSPTTVLAVVIASGTAATSSSSSSSTSHDPTTSNVTAAMITAEELVNEIVMVERGIRDPTLDPDEIAAFGRRQQRAYRLLARNTGMQDAVTSLIPSDVATPYGFNVAARQAITDHAAANPPPPDQAPATLPANLPAWTILPPRPIAELLADYQEAEATFGVPWEFLAAINFVETRMGRIVGDSSAGARGPMQFLPATWAACCTGDVNDPHDAILGAAQYLVDRGAPADMPAALYGYNPNAGYVGAVTAYAQNLMADPVAYHGYHAWEVFVGSDAGTVRLPAGFVAGEAIDASDYVEINPEDLVGITL